MYMVFEGEIGVKVSSQVSDFCWSFYQFSLDIYGGVSGLVKLLPTPKVDGFSLFFIQFEFYCFHPGFWCLDVFDGLKVLLIEWSSAKPLRVSESGTILDSFKA